MSDPNGSTANVEVSSRLSCWSFFASFSIEHSCYPVMRGDFLCSFSHPAEAHIKCITGRSMDQ